MKSLSALVGMKYQGTEKLVASLPQGEALTLIRDPNNRFDPNAIQVWARGVHVGYIKATQAKPIAIAMDEIIGTTPGVTGFSAKLSVDGGKVPMVEIDETSQGISK